jgi:hypothetical protein
MNKVQIKSIFEKISEWAFTTADLQQVQKDTIIFVQSTGINDKDKKAIIKSINECKTVVRFQMYVANSLLKYEGLGADRMNKEYKPINK